MENTKSCHQLLQGPEANLSKPESKAVKDMNKHRYYKSVKKNRLGRHKFGSEQLEMLDDVDERLQA